MNLERHIINSIKQQNNISDKDVEIYEFGLHLLILKLFHISCILFIGYVGREFFKVILFLLLYSTFRKYAGGYHSQTHIGCLGISIISTICFIVFLKITLPEFVYRCMWVISAGIIWILAPQDTENRRLNNSEIRYFRKKSKNIVCIYSIICLLLYAIISKIILGVLIIQGIMLLAAHIEKQLCKEKNNFEDSLF